MVSWRLLLGFLVGTGAVNPSALAQPEPRPSVEDLESRTLVPHCNRNGPSLETNKLKVDPEFSYLAPSCPPNIYITENKIEPDQKSIELLPGLAYRGNLLYKPAIAVQIDGIRLEFSFLRELKSRTKRDRETIGELGLDVQGQTETRSYGYALTVGVKVFQKQISCFSLRNHIQALGALEFNLPMFTSDKGTELPGNPDPNIQLGLGLRADFRHNFSCWTNVPVAKNIYVGFGGSANYIQSQTSKLKDIIVDPNPSYVIDTSLILGCGL